MSADIDPLALRLDMVIIAEVSVAHESGYAEDIGQSLTAIDGVFQVYYTMGDVDEIVTIDGVNKTASEFVMRELKTSTRTVENMSEEMVRNAVDGTD